MGTVSTQAAQERQVAVLLPVLDDWQSLQHVLREVCSSFPPSHHVTVHVVNDGSQSIPSVSTIFGVNDSWTLVHLGCNLGHQRAICIGLASILESYQPDVILVMDSDGEDDPKSSYELVRTLENGKCDIVVAQRASRSEGRRFRLMYWGYKQIFRILVGEQLDFGNFSALRPSAAKRLVYMSETWNHFPGSIIRSRLSVRKMPVARATRTEGSSRMNVPALVTHGLAGLSVFMDRVMSRLLIASSIVIAFLTAVMGIGLFVRLTGQVPIPGWLALITTAAFVGVVQISATLLILAFLSLSARAQPSAPPFEFSRRFVERVETSPRMPGEQKRDST